MARVELDGLDGSNPLGFLAGLGVLAVLPPCAARLSWSVSVLPTAVLEVDGDENVLVESVLADRDRALNSVALQGPDPHHPIPDVKFPRPKATRQYLEAAATADSDGFAERIAAGLVAEASRDNSGQAKPTDLHFTAGKQRFLEMARSLGEALTADDITEAVHGPWRYAVATPSFMWDISDDRVYALSAINPADEAKHTVPGADWLAFRGLSLLPVIGMLGTAGRAGRTITPGASGSWKSGTWTWPLWDVGLTDGVARILMAQVPRREAPDRPWSPPTGVFRMLRSEIVRSDQGGYGTIRPPRVVWERPTP